MLIPLQLTRQEERQVRLREHARRLIAETRARSQHLDLPTSPIRMITQRITLSPERSTISPIHHQHAAAAAAAAADGGVFFGDSVVAAEHAAKENSSPSKRLSAAHLFEEAASRRGSPSSLLSGGKLALSERNGNTPLTEQQQRASPQREKKVRVVFCYVLPYIYLFFTCPFLSAAGAAVVHRKRTGGTGTGAGVHRSEGERTGEETARCYGRKRQR